MSHAQLSTQSLVRALPRAGAGAVLALAFALSLDESVVALGPAAALPGVLLAGILGSLLGWTAAVPAALGMGVALVLSPHSPWSSAPLSTAAWMAALGIAAGVGSVLHGRRRDAREELAALQAHHQRLVENVRDVLFQTDTEGRWTFLNPAWTEIMGHPVAATLGRPFMEYVHPDDRAHSAGLFEMLMRGEAPYARDEARARTASGEYRWVEVSVRLDTAPDGRVLGATGRLVDMTEPRAAAAALRLAGEQLARRDAVLRAIPQAGRLLLGANAGAQAVHRALAVLGEAMQADRAYVFQLHAGADGTRLLSQRFEWSAPGVEPQIDNQDMQHIPVDSAGYAPWLAPLLEGGEAAIIRTEDVPEPARGHLVEQDILSMALVPVRVAGEVWGVMGFDDCAGVRDWNTAELGVLHAAAEMMGASVARADAEGRLTAVLEASPAAIYTLHLRDGQIPRLGWSSPSVARVLGLVEDVAPTAEWWRSAVHPQDLPRLLGGELPGPGRPSLVSEYRVRARDGGWRWVRDEQRLLEVDGDTRTVVGSWIDITERRAAEDQLRELTAQLEARVEERTIELRATNEALAEEVDERRRVAARLEHSERHFRSLIENASDVTIVFQSDGKITYISPSMQRVLGWTPDDIRSRPFASLVHPDDLELGRARIATLVAGRSPEPLRAQYRLRHADGGWRILEVTSRNLLHDPAVAGIVSNGRDVTERVHAAEQLERSLSLLQATLESTADGILVVDLEGRMESWNQRFVDIWGFPPEVMEGRDDSAAITWALDHVADPEAFTSAIRDLQASYDGERLDVVEMRDGRRYERFSRPQRVGEQIVGRVWSYRDVTERERSRAELERSLSLLQATLESTADGIVVVGRDDRMTHWNRRFVEMWGLDHADLLRDQEHAVRQVGGQLVDPEGFLEAVRTLAVDPQAESLDVAHLRDGRVFECYSQPQRLGDRVVGRVWSYRDITERVRAEDALRASEERFRQIAENMRQVFYLVEVAENRVSYVSPAFRDIFGIEPEALMRDRGVWLPLLHPDDRDRVAGMVTTPGEPAEISYRIVRPDGELRWVRTRAVPVHDASGHVYRVAGITEDVTERVLAEEAVRASEARFREIASTLHGVFYTAEVHPARVTYVSPGFQRVFGRDPSELLADVRAWLGYVHPDDRSQLATLMGRRGAPLDHTYRIVMPNGEVRWLHTRGFPVQDEDGQVRRSVGLTEDVTGRVLAEQAVRDSEARFREIAGTLHGVFFTADIERSRVTYVSPAYERVFGRDPAELLTDPRLWLRGVHPDDLREVMDVLEARTEPVDHTYRIIRPDGQLRWVNTRGFPVQDEDGRVRRSVGITEDVTDRVLAEQAVRDSEARFREIADALHGVFYIVELEPLGVVYLSPAFERVFGRAPDAVLADIRAWIGYIHPDDRAKVADQLTGKGEPAQVTYRIVLPDGEVRWLHTRGFPVRDEDGVVRRSVGITENVTDRVLAEQALAASEERFRQLAENIREVFFIQDVESGDMLYVSPAYEEVWGRPRAELDQNPRAWLDALHPDDVPELWNDGPLREGVQESSYRIVRPDGEIRWIRSRGFPVTGADGRVYRLAGLSEDITDRVRADEALRAGEQRFRQIAENIREVFYIYDLDETRLLYVSPAYQGIWGRPTADVLQDPRAWFDGVHPDDAPALMRTMGAGGGEYEAEYRVVRPDGEVRWIWGRGFPVTDGAGRVYREVGIAEDVTARKQAELAIRDAERRAQETAARMRAIATAAAAVLGAESPGRLRELLEEVSRTVLDFDVLLLLLYDAEQNVFEDLGGQDSGVPVAPARVPAPGTPAGRAVAERRTLVTRSSADPASAGARLTGTGRRTESAVRAPVLAGERVLGVFSVQSYQPALYTGEDVEVVEALAALAATALENLRLSRERRAAEEALHESQRQLLHSQKMEAVGRLAGGIAHDFNNMLMAIGGHAELLRTEPAMPSSCRWQADEIHKAAERAAGLTRQLLAFSRKQVMQPRPLSVNAVITDMEDMLRRLIGETIRMRTSLAPGVGVVRADPGQLEQVLMNLVVNARDAMPDGGTVTLETGNVMLDGEYAGLHDEVIPGPYVMLAVADTGMGMDAAVRQRIFEPFFTTKPQGKGTGLGLSTVYGVVRQSGGHVWVYSELGVGTTFKIYLPREDAPHEPAELPAALPRLERGSETILLVEDDEVVRELLRMFLQRQGYRVLGAGSGGDALRVAESAGEPPDLLLTDVVMPGMSGRELATEVRGRWPGVAVIYMSGYTDDAIVHHGVLDPGSEFIQKPVSPDVLAHRIRAVLEAR